MTLHWLFIHPWKGNQNMISFIDISAVIDGSHLEIIFCLANFGFALNLHTGDCD